LPVGCLRIVAVAPPNLSDAEQSLWKAFPGGEWVDLRAGNPAEDDVACGGDWGERRIIRAGVITGLLLGAAAPEPGQFPAVRLRGARVSGRLDVMGAAVAYALVCEGCYFDEVPRFVEATTKTVRIVNSWLPGVNAARMRLEGILILRRTAVGGMLILDRAKITGELCLREAVIGDDSGSTAVAADGLAVDGDLDCAVMTSRGLVQLRGARITGSLYAAGARISCSGEEALNADHAVIGGTFDGDRLAVEGKTRLRNARVGGNLRLRGARLHNPGGTALSAGGLIVEGGMWCRDGLTAAGELRLIGARVGGSVELAGARLDRPGGIALCLDRATVADVDAAGLVVAAGAVTLTGAQIAGRLNLHGAQLGDALALVADGSVIGTDLILSQLHAKGEVRARTSRIGGRVQLWQATVDNGSGTAIRLSRTDVTADVFCNRMTVTGKVRVAGARIGGRLEMRRVRLRNPAGTALDAEGLQAAEFYFLPAEPVQGRVCLSNARIGVLADDPASWPGQLELDGLVYESLDPQLPARQRLTWLARDSRASQPQLFEQLAALYARIGQPAEARRVLCAKERHQRAAMSWPGRAWGRMQDFTVGYGYQPWRAVLWFAVLLAAGSIVYAISPPPPLNPASAPHFSPVAYTLDLLVPVVGLGQKDAFNPAGLEQWLSYLLIAAGWVLATTIAAGIARVLTRR
jgi:cytoskeletal protein CcmA (bactofilin family)